MTTGTPDWSVPLSPKIKRLIDTDVTLQGDIANLGPFDCTGYTGILLEHLAITGDASPGFTQVQFQDPVASVFTVPTYVIDWRGDKGIKLNIPVMGPQVSLHYFGSTNGHVSHCSAIAHTGGGSASYGRNATVLAGAQSGAVPAGGSVVTEATLIREGPGALTLQATANGLRAYVFATDHQGTSYPIADTGNLSGPAATVPLWIPPYSISVTVSNPTAAAINYAVALVLGRS